MSFTSDSDDHFIYLSNKKQLVGAKTPRPNYAVGDRLYLNLDWPHPRQIRPIVSDDMITGIGYHPEMYMVVFRLPDGDGTIRPVVRLLPREWQNTPANADAAWRLVLEEAPGIIELYGDVVLLDTEGRSAGART